MSAVSTTQKKPMTLSVCGRHGRQMTVLLLTTLLLAGCAMPNLRPSFMRKAAPEPVVALAAEPTVDPSLTPRELLTARLVNSRAADDAVPGMTVGKLVEFADRYLTCDCAETRFARAWQRTADGYLLNTHSAQVQPLDFRCVAGSEGTVCYLREIDRGANLPVLTERFMAGSEFIRFIYQNGSKCERVEPCPAAAVPSK